MAKAVYKVTFTAPKEDVKVSSNSVTLTGLSKDQAQGVSDALGYSRSASYTMDLSRKEASEEVSGLNNLERSLRVFQAAVHSKTAGTLQVLEQIARKHFDLQTLNTRNSDSADFRDLAVWQVKAALEAAYEAGVKAGSK